MYLRNIIGSQAFFRIGQVGQNLEHNNIGFFPDTPEALAHAREFIAKGALALVTREGQALDAGHNPLLAKVAAVVADLPAVIKDINQLKTDLGSGAEANTPPANTPPSAIVPPEPITPVVSVPETAPVAKSSVLSRPSLETETPSETPPETPAGGPAEI